MKSSVVRAASSRRGVGHRQHRVAGDRDQRPDLALARRLDLVGQRRRPGTRRSPRAGRGPGCASARSAKPCPRPGPRRGCAGSGNIAPPGRSRLPVRTLSTSTSQLASVPNSTVRRADPAVDRGASARAASSAGEARGSSPASTPHRSATASGVNGSTQRAHLVDAVDVLGQAPERRPGPRRTASCTIAEQQERVGARPDRHVLVGRRGGAAAPRVDHDERAAARPQRLQPAGEVRRGPQAAVGASTGSRRASAGSRCGRCRARRSTKGSPYSRPRRHVLGHLVDGAGGEDVARAQRLAQRARVEAARAASGRSGCRGRGATASRPCSAITAVSRSSHHGERLVPAHRDELAVAAHQRRGAAGPGRRRAGRATRPWGR